MAPMGLKPKGVTGNLGRGWGDRKKRTRKAAKGDRGCGVYRLRSPSGPQRQLSKAPGQSLLPLTQKALPLRMSHQPADCPGLGQDSRAVSANHS